MKKFGIKLCVILAVVAVMGAIMFAFAACDSKEKSSSENSNAITDVLTDEEIKIFMGFANDDNVIYFTRYNDPLTNIPKRTPDLTQEQLDLIEGAEFVASRTQHLNTFTFLKVDENESYIAVALYIFDSEKAASEIMENEKALKYMKGAQASLISHKRIGNRIIFESKENVYNDVVLSAPKEDMSKEQVDFWKEVFLAEGAVEAVLGAMGHNDGTVISGVTANGSQISWALLDEQAVQEYDLDDYAEGSYIKPYGDGYYAVKLISKEGVDYD